MRRLTAGCPPPHTWCRFIPLLMRLKRTRLDIGVIRGYLIYAKANFQPSLTDSASQRLFSAYVDMREVGSGRGQITGCPRQLESLIRLAKAHAKMRFSASVELPDVEEAWRLHRGAVERAATHRFLQPIGPVDLLHKSRI